jgi:hypothetical protein
MAIKCQWDSLEDEKFKSIDGWLAVDVNIFYFLIKNKDFWKCCVFGSIG